MLLEMYANLWICCMDVTGFFWKLMFFLNVCYWKFMD
jgi:hypothetical protein